MMSKKFLAGLLFVILMTSCQNSKDEAFDKEKYKVELSDHAEDYMMELKSVLVANMKEGGPLQAVNVCSDTATDLTSIYSKKMNVEVKRVSFKNRNANNIPDSFEERALLKFENIMVQGKLNSETNLLEKLSVDGNEMVKFAKPIFVDAPCLNCHGSEAQISDQVAEVLREKYPGDKAKGYKIGDLRGAISVSKIL
jgi:uncharacterized protein DUF3365